MAASGHCRPIPRCCTGINDTGRMRGPAVVLVKAALRSRLLRIDREPPEIQKNILGERVLELS